MTTTEPVVIPQAKKYLSVEGTENVGHGHVYKRPDGARAKCGGPGLCSQCAEDLARLNEPTSSAPVVREEVAQVAWICSTRKQGTAGGNDPADCNWPFCGCDPYADKVLAAVEESGAAPEAETLLNRWRIWACGQQGQSPFEDTKTYLDGHRQSSTARITDLERRLQVAKVALEYYANGIGFSEIEDGGERARQALAEIGASHE
jgi:hypothetical protein